MKIKKLSNKIFINPVTKNSSFNQRNLNSTVQREMGQADINIDKELKEIVDTLFNKEVQKPIISSILNQLKKYKNFLHPTNIDSYVLSSIASIISTTKFEVNKKGRPKKVALVGPTGCRKNNMYCKTCCYFERSYIIWMSV